MTDRLTQLLDKFVHKNKQRTTYPARLGDGDGNLYPVDENGNAIPGVVWARITLPSGSTIRHIRCRKSMPAYGSEVWVALGIDSVYEVVEEKADAAIPFWGDSGTGNTGKHASNHSRFGADPLRLDALLYMPLLTRPNDTPSLSVYVEPYTYSYGIGQAWNGGLIDLTSYVPGGTDEQRFVIVGLNADDNALAVYSSAITVFTYSSGNIRTVPYSRADVAEILVQEGFIPSAAVRLYAGMTRIELFDIFEDCRNWIEVPSRKHNYNASAIPTVNDDRTEGYNRGSFWFVNGTEAYVNFDPTPGAADWRPFGGTQGSTSGNVFSSLFVQGTDYQYSLQSNGLNLARYDAPAAPQLVTLSARGNVASPSDVQLNDVLYEVINRGYGGGERDAAWEIITVIEPTPSSTGMGAKRQIYITPLASVTPYNNRTETDADGHTFRQRTAGNQIAAYETNSITHKRLYQNHVATTNNTITTIATFTIPASTTMFIDAFVTARRTGGSAGVAEDGAAYIVRVVVKNVAGTATIIGSSTTTVIGESQAGWDAVFTVTGATILCQVTGATNNNISWDVSAEVYQTS